MTNTLKLSAAFALGLTVTALSTFAQSYGRGRNVQFVDGATISPTSVQASGTGDQFMCTATTAVCEVESSINATTMTSTVPAFDIGPTATPDTNDRLACFSYGPSGSKTRMMCVDKEGDVNMTSLAVGTTPSGIRAHFLAETTSYTPTVFDEKHVVFGRSATSGASSGGVWFSYHTTDNEGIIGALSPTTSWRPLSVAATSLKMRPAGGNATVTLGTGVTTTGAFDGNSYNATVASGNQAYTCTNVGCRLSLGNTARYFYDTGSIVEFTGSVLGSASGFQGNLTTGGTTEVRGSSATTGVSIRAANATSTGIVNFVHDTTTRASIDSTGNVSGNGFVATTASGSALTGGGASGGLLLTSNAAAAWTTTSNAAITLQAANDLGNGSDRVFAVKKHNGTSLFSIDDYGHMYVGDGATRAIYSRYFFAATTPIEIGTYMTAGSEKNPIIMFTQSNFTADDVNLWSLQNNGSTKVATFSKDGLLRVNKSNAAKPTCNADNRGRVFYLDGVTGVGATADTYEICMKDASDVYAWKTIVTP